MCVCGWPPSQSGYANFITHIPLQQINEGVHYHNILCVTRKYWKILFLHFINIAVVNAYIIHTEKEKITMTHYAFREKLVRSLSDVTSAVPISRDKENGREAGDFTRGGWTQYKCPIK